jgi:hypothetical protein
LVSSARWIASKSGLRARDPEVGADARVVHKHVERSRVGADRRCRALDRGRVGHVEPERPAAQRLRSLASLCLVASGNDDVIAAFGELARRLAPDAAVGAADKSNWHSGEPYPHKGRRPGAFGATVHAA